MANYIDKDALVAEIRKQMKIELGYGYTTEQRVVADAGKNLALRNLLFFLDTLEVKEVDLNSKIEDWLYHGSITPAKYDAYSESDIENTAKYFFELGLKVVQKGE